MTEAAPITGDGATVLIQGAALPALYRACLELIARRSRDGLAARRPGGTAHRLRHWYGSTLVRDGADLRTAHSSRSCSGWRAARQASARRISFLPRAFPACQRITACDDRPMTEAIAVGGDFWVLEKPKVRVRGGFSAEVGNKPEARLDAGLVADPREGASMPVKSWPAKSIEAFQPVTLQGQLDTGESVTLLDARNHGGRRSPPHYVAHVAVLGAHVAGTDQPYSAVRFRMDRPYWLAHLAEGDSSVVQDDGSTLSVEASQEGNWLVYASSAPATLRQLEIRMVSGCLVLAQLALDQDLVTRQTQVRVNTGEPWLTVHGPGFCAPPDKFDPKTLLPRKELTVERFAEWITLNDKLDGLAWAVARPVKAPLQTQVLVVTSLVEGLHRRLPYEQSRFPGVEKPALRRVLEAARDAAGPHAEAEGLDREAATDAIIFLKEVSFRDRATEVVTEVCGAVPEIRESVADLPSRLTKARNEMAHHIRPDEKKDSLEIRYRRWSVVVNVTLWLLRGLLLLHAGIEPHVLRDGYLANGRFAFFRANAARRVRELGWELR